jgi:hypothetical protein
MPSHDDFDPYLAWLDIKPAEHPVDHYRLLGVDRFESDAELIQQAADSRMSHVRNFQTGPRGRFTQRLLNDLAAAKICLLNPSTKATYDAVLQGQATAAKNATPVPPPVQESDPAEDSLPPANQPPKAHGMVAEPTPPPVMDSSDEESMTKPLTQMERVAARPHAKRNLGAVFAIVVMLGLAVGGVFAIVQMQEDNPAGDSSDRSNEANTDSGKKSRKAAGEQSPVLKPKEPVMIEQEGDGSFNFPATLAKLEGATLKRINQGSDGVITNWSNKDDSISWEFNVTKFGFFKAQLEYATEESAAGGRYAIEIGKQKPIDADVRVGDPPGSYVTDEIVVLINRKGRSRIRLRALDIPNGELMRFRLLKLVLRDSGTAKRPD